MKFFKQRHCCGGTIIVISVLMDKPNHSIGTHQGDNFIFPNTLVKLAVLGRIELFSCPPSNGQMRSLKTIDDLCCDSRCSWPGIRIWWSSVSRAAVLCKSTYSWRLRTMEQKRSISLMCSNLVTRICLPLEIWVGVFYRLKCVNLVV